MVHAHVHEHITHKAVAVGWAVIEDLAHHRVVKIMSGRVRNGFHHEHRIPQHVGVRWVDIAVDGVFNFGAKLTKRRGENQE